jgi:hypothetical protein
VVSQDPQLKNRRSVLFGEKEQVACHCTRQLARDARPERIKRSPTQEITNSGDHQQSPFSLSLLQFSSLRNSAHSGTQLTLEQRKPRRPATMTRLNDGVVMLTRLKVIGLVALEFRRCRQQTAPLQTKNIHPSFFSPSS